MLAQLSKLYGNKKETAETTVSFIELFLQITTI